MAMCCSLPCLVAAAAALSCVQGASLEEMLFQSFVSNYSRSYKDDPAAMSERFRVFQQSLARQRMLNEYEREHGGKAVYGINRFSDLTPEEFKASYLSPPRQLPKRKSDLYSGETSISNTDHIDWREKGVIGAIRDQKKTVESVYAINNHQKLNFTLSSQQLISCETALGLNGCEGGTLHTAFDTLKTNQTIVVSENVYPFNSSDGRDPPCKSSLPSQGLVLTDYTYNPELGETKMMAMLQQGPVATSVDALPWQDYTSGIVRHHCANNYIFHAVQVVGYSFGDNLPYWIVRNTWGEDWGEKGYIRLRRNVSMCGIGGEVAAVHSVKAVGL